MFYAISGICNAETVHQFKTKQERDEWVDRHINKTDNDLYTENARPATLKQAIAFVGGKKAFDLAIESKQYA